MYHHARKPTPRSDRLESTKLSLSLPEFPGPVKREPDSEVSSSLSYKKYVTGPPCRGNTVPYRRNNNHILILHWKTLHRLNNILPASKEKPVARIQTLSDSESSTVSNCPSVYCELDQLLLDQDIECHAEEEEAVALEDTGFCVEQDDVSADKYLDSFKTMQISAQ
jgi:hypothetical protein